MFGNMFGKKESDLNGSAFKELFASTKNAVLLDVRTAGEFAGGTLPAAENMDVMSADFKNKVKKLSSQKTYFVFCRSGNRSGSAVAQLTEQGLKAYNLEGGISAWPRN